MSREGERFTRNSGGSDQYDPPMRTLVKALPVLILLASCGTNVVADRGADPVTSEPETSEPVTIAAPSDTTFSVLPTRPIQELEGTSSRWTAHTQWGSFTMDADHLGEVSAPHLDMPGLVTTPEDANAHSYFTDALLSVPTPQWERLVAAPDEEVELDSTVLELGPVDVRRTVVGSLSGGFRFELDAPKRRVGHVGCAICGARFKQSLTDIRIGDGYVTVDLLPPGARDVAVDLPFWVVDDYWMHATIVAVEYPDADTRGTMTFVDADGEPQRRDVGVYIDGL